LFRAALARTSGTIKAMDALNDHLIPYKYHNHGTLET
jgi:hypothetical protein